MTIFSARPDRARRGLGFQQRCRRVRAGHQSGALDLPLYRARLSRRGSLDAVPAGEDFPFRWS